MDRHETALEHGTPAGEVALLVDGDALGGVVGMRHDHARDPRRERRVDDGVDLFPTEMPGGEGQVVARNHLEHSREAALGQPHRLARDPGRGELVLDRAPDRLLGRVEAGAARLVLGVDGRQPDDPGASSGCDLDRLSVQAADAGIQRDRAQGVHARYGTAHDGRPLRRRGIVGLEHEAREPELGEAASEAEIVDPPRCEVGLDVDVEVVGAANELARAGRRLGALSDRGRQGARPPRARAVIP